MGMVMRNFRNALRLLLALGFLLGSWAGISVAQQVETKKLAQTGMKFLQVATNARQTAMGDAFTAADGYSASMFYNPAGMAKLGSLMDVSIGQTQWIADINHKAVSFAIKLEDIGTFGLAAQYVDYGEIEATVRVDNTINSKGYLDVGTIKPWGLAFGIGYARSLSDKFSVGGNVKFVKQDLGESFVGSSYASTNSKIPDSTQTNAQSVTAFDFGVLYRTGFKSLTFGMTIRNFSKEVTYQKESFQLPLTFKIGLSMNMMDLVDVEPGSQDLLLSIDAEHPRDYPEQLRIGVEYVFSRTVAFRLGYVGPTDERSISYGIGFQQAWFGTQLGVD
ncbi:MAG: DUF3308 domain-containing protein, partial [Bacteroidetes bacterium]|nr:DUF3308 domain-containing protein [Bacteroidota bacterium]